MRQAGKVNVIVYAPNTTAGRDALSHRIASIHADAVISRLQKLACPSEQKLLLLDSVIAQCKQPFNDKSYNPDRLI